MAGMKLTGHLRETPGWPLGVDGGERGKHILRGEADWMPLYPVIFALVSVAALWSRCYSPYSTLETKEGQERSRTRARSSSKDTEPGFRPPLRRWCLGSRA